MFSRSVRLRLVRPFNTDLVQFNFYDHTKLILSRDGLVVSVIDKHHALRTWSLEALLEPMEEDIPPKEKRRVEGVIHKVEYAK